MGKGGTGHQNGGGRATWSASERTVRLPFLVKEVLSTSSAPPQHTRDVEERTRRKMADIVKEVRVLEDGESVWREDEDEGAFSPIRSRPELYGEFEVANLTLRFSVGDVVQCTVDKGRAEGVVVQRFYREEEWARGCYAAVRAAFEAASLQAPASCVPANMFLLC